MARQWPGNFNSGDRGDGDGGDGNGIQSAVKALTPQIKAEGARRRREREKMPFCRSYLLVAANVPQLTVGL